MPDVRSTTIFDEDFTEGLGLDGRWQLVEGGGVTADDGVVLTSDAGISVVPTGRNPQTLEPAFTKDITGPMAHLKWLVTTTQTFATADGPLRVRFRAGATRFGMADHPYGSAVADAASDYRLGSATVNVIDFESGMVFDFWLTDTAIYPYYERIRTGPDSCYRAFAQTTTVARTPGTMSDLCIVIDGPAGTVWWEVDGTTVGSVNQIGVPDPTWTTVLDHGGSPEPAAPRQFQVALGLMTLLDAAYPPSDAGLVDLGSSLVLPASFGTGPTLFGQGVQLDIARVTVERD